MTRRYGNVAVTTFNEALGVRARLMLLFVLVSCIFTGALVVDVVQFQETGESLRIIQEIYVPLSRKSARLARSSNSLQPEEAEKLKTIMEDKSRDPVGAIECERQIEVVVAALKRKNVSIGSPAEARAVAEASEGLEQLGDLAERRIGILSSRAARLQARAERTAVGLVGLALVVGGIQAWALARALAPLSRLTEQAKALEKGEVPPPLGFSGHNEVAILGQAFDRMVEAQSRLARSERLALVGQLLAQVTHEVRNPLNAIGLHTEILLDESSDMEHRAILKLVLSEVRRLEALTERYLELARGEKGSGKVEPVEIRELLREVVAFDQELLKKAGVQLIIQGEAVIINTEEAALMQVVRNLLRNAVEARASQVIIRLSGEQQKLLLQVEDNGVGMDRALVERIFEPFVSEKEGGTGLGLAITRQLVEALGGTISCKSGVGEGACFSIQLPSRTIEQTGSGDGHSSGRR
jgi:signal transduction histidine kinase